MATLGMMMYPARGGLVLESDEMGVIRSQGICTPYGSLYNILYIFNRVSMHMVDAYGEVFKRCDKIHRNCHFRIKTEHFVGTMTLRIPVATR